MKYTSILFALVFMSCGNQRNSAVKVQTANIPSKSMTLYTDKTELFVEFPALVVGNASRFAAHFTVLEGHQPVRKGSVTLSLIKGDKGLRSVVEAPSSPGIFSPTLQPKEAGNFQLIFEITTPTYTDKIIVHDIIVYATPEEAIAALGDAAEVGGITFLKEQAWKMDFQTAPVILDTIYDVINTSGVWMPSPGSVKTLVASADGVVDFAMDNMTEGALVKKGQLLMALSSSGLATNNLGAEIASAKAKFQQVKSAYDRKKELYESKIVPKSEFEKVESDYLVSKSNYETLSAGVSGSGKQVRAPFDGFIKSINVSNGEYAAQGKPLVSVATHRSRMLKTQVAPSSRLSIENLRGIWFQNEDAHGKT